MEKGTTFCVPRIIHQSIPMRSIPSHNCPFCQCNFNYMNPMPSCFAENCIIRSQVTLNNIPYHTNTKIFTVKGQNIHRDKITLVKSNSPYSKKITIRYQSPKKIDSQLPIFSNYNSPQYASQSSPRIFMNQQQKATRPKILDRRKNKEKDKKIFFSFKSVKSASTDAFFESPSKNIGSQAQQNRYGSTDQTDSAKSLSRVSIDQRVFDE